MFKHIHSDHFNSSSASHQESTRSSQVRLASFTCNSLLLRIIINGGFLQLDFTLQDSGADETCVSGISAEEDDGKNKESSQHVQTQHTVVERQVTSLFFFAPCSDDRPK